MEADPPFDAAQSRHPLAIFFAAASEIWFPSNTVAAPLPPTTYSDARVDLGGVAVANRGTGVLPAFGFSRGGKSSTSGGTEGPNTSVSPFCPQISSLHTGGFGAEPPTPTNPIICLLTAMGSPPEFANSPSRSACS